MDTTDLPNYGASPPLCHSFFDKVEAQTKEGLATVIAGTLVSKKGVILQSVGPELQTLLF
jgi:hypothetical protein